MRGAILAGLLWLFLPAPGDAAGPPEVGGQLPPFTLAAPKEAADRAYLGLAGSGAFTLPGLKARAVIVEIFSMYCPICQKEAPKVNRLFTLIEGEPAWRGLVKMVGLGAGNSAFEVGLFRKKYQVPFPLFADADFTLHKRLGEVRTPYFLVLKIPAPGQHQVVLSRLGAFGSPAGFLEEIVSVAGLR